MMEKQFRLEALECAIGALEDAIDAIMELGSDNGADADCLREMKHGYEVEAQEIRAEIETEEAADERALEREYYGSVM